MEEHRPPGAAGHVAQTVPDDLPGSFGPHPSPEIAGGLLHEQPRPAPSPGAGQVSGERVLVGRSLPGGVRVDVNRYEIQVGSPPPRVDRNPGAEREVGGDGDIRVGGPQDVALGAVVAAHGVGEETAEVQQVCRVGQVLGGARRVDLLPVRIALPPKRRGPRVVERGQAAVAAAQSGAEGAGSVLPVGVGAVLVVHMPQRQRGVVGIAFRERPGDA